MMSTFKTLALALRTKSALFALLYVITIILVLVIANIDARTNAQTIGMDTTLHNSIHLWWDKPTPTPAIASQAAAIDPRALTLKSFLRKYGSPLYPHAEFIVKTADTYGLDYRLIPAIAMKESTGCKVIPEGSYNCWGWGITGGKILKFNSFEHGIETVAKGLKTKYVDYGLETPEQIMTKYNPSSPNGEWAKGVRHFFNKIDTFRVDTADAGP